jgi:hypothetical protein
MKFLLMFGGNNEKYEKMAIVYLSLLFVVGKVKLSLSQLVQIFSLKILFAINDRRMKIII